MLASFAAASVDVLYVVTGRRLPAAAQANSGGNLTAVEAERRLTQIEAELHAVEEWPVRDEGGRYKGSEQRLRKVRKSFRTVEAALSTAAAELGWQPTEAVRHALISLMYRFGLEKDDVMDLMLAMRSSLVIRGDEGSVLAPVR